MLNSANSTSATQAKERLYAQLAGNLGRMSRAVGQTADLCEQLQIDLHAMRIFAGLDAAKFMTIAANLNEEGEDEEAGKQAAADNKKCLRIDKPELSVSTNPQPLHTCHVTPLIKLDPATSGRHPAPFSRYFNYAHQPAFILNLVPHPKHVTAILPSASDIQLYGTLSDESPHPVSVSYLCILDGKSRPIAEHGLLSRLLPC